MTDDNEVPKPRSLKIKTWTGFAIKTPNKFSDEIVRVRPSMENPEAYAVFYDLKNAQWFCKEFNIPEDCIFPVCIARTDGKVLVPYNT